MLMKVYGKGRRGGMAKRHHRWLTSAGQLYPERLTCGLIVGVLRASDRP